MLTCNTVTVVKYENVVKPKPETKPMRLQTLRRTPIAAAILTACTNPVLATDPTYLLDVYDMTVGTRLGEGLIVAESCIDPADTSPTCPKTKYF